MRSITTSLLVVLAACTGGATVGDATSPRSARPAPRDDPSPDAGALTNPVQTADAGTAPDGGAVPAPAPAPQPDPPAPAPPAAIFPPDNPWNTRIDSEPVDPGSDAYIADMGADTPLTAGWDSEGHGIPYVEVGADQPMVAISYWGFPKESDPGPFPVPWNAQPDPSTDRHVVVVDRQRGFLYELLQGSRNADGSWAASNGARWDLRSNALRPLRWTSADAAGLPIFPGLVRYDEVDSGWIGHALRFVVGHSQQGFVFPATHASGSCPVGSSCPPMGLRVRLKKSVDISGFDWRMQVILQALKDYGMFVADNGGGTSWWLSGAPDPRFSDQETRSLAQIHGRDFEVVQHGPISPQ